MSARRQIIAALSEDSMGGIATLQDVDRAEQLVDAHRVEVLAEAADAIATDRDTTNPSSGKGAYRRGMTRAEDIVHGLAAGAGEKSSPAGAVATPGPTGRVAQLLNAIRTARGRWTTVTAFRFYRDHIRALDAMPNTQLRAVARGDLRDLAAWGHLIRHEEPGRQYYTLKTGKDGR